MCDSERIFDFISRTPESMHMITFLFSPWGIPANYRQMQGSGVNTYKWVNERGESVLVKYHWEPKQGIKNLTQIEAEEIQGKNFNHATQDLYEAIERGDYPEWELYVQIMSDDEHPELDFDPLDDTKLWPMDQFPFLPVGRMVLNKNPEDYFAEVEQVTFGTGVLVDGLDFSDDKMLQGRTFSYSDTQRYRVGPNYQQLPINAPKKHVATNLRGGQMAYHVDVAPGQNPHINYEPSSLGGLKEVQQSGKEHTPFIQGHLVRQSIERRNDYKQAGMTYQALQEWERVDLIQNLINALRGCHQDIQDRMIDHFSKCDSDYGRRVAKGLNQQGTDGTASTRGQLGNTEATKAVQDAEKMGHPSQPY